MGGCVGGLGKKSSAFSAGGASRRSTRSVPEKRVECKKQVFSDTDSMENNPGNSNVHDSIPSGSSTVVNSDVHTAENNANSEFVNHGLIAWNEQRRAWVGDRSRRTHRVPREPVISWCSTYDDLLATNQPFERPVPLSEMVDFLVDIWHEEGLYD